MQHELIIFDLDGTLFRGDVPTPFAVETVLKLRRRGQKVRFLTNNSGKSRHGLWEKLDAMGFEPKLDEVFGTASGVARYCKENGISDAYILGEDSLRDALREASVTLSGDSAVIVGICRSYSYDDVNEAMQRILSGSAFIATNRDATYPLAYGKLVPGAGSLVSAIVTCTETEPVLIGKPNSYMIRWILEEAGVEPASVLVVGDRIETDIEAGIAAGCHTHLVLCGVTGADHPDIARLSLVASPDISSLF